MAELSKMRRTAERIIPGAPHEVLLVMDATTGQNGLQQARLFTESAGVTGIVLTKLDGTAKGGIAVAIARELKVPVRYVGVGEKLEDLLPFDSKAFVDSCSAIERSGCRQNDQQWMERALQQAERSVGLASPNPAVGCVLVQDERVVGEGFHEYDRRDHAEVVALMRPGPQAHGATAYVTLEPCSHQGRTGPCADALIAAGVARVVTATPTPTRGSRQRSRPPPRRRHRGHTGVLEEAARRLNDSFAKFITAPCHLSP